MKKNILFLIGCLITGTILAQESHNVVCRDFTFQQEISTRGKSLRNVFELTLSQTKNFKVLERDKMDKIFEALQEEKNLFMDLSNEWKKKLQLENIDYLVIGDLNENLAKDNFDLIIQFIKITGDNMTVKLPMFITLSRNQLSDNSALKKIFQDEIQIFLKTYFLGLGENSLITIPKFYDELKKRDSTITKLKETVYQIKNEDSLKDLKINKLNAEVNNIKIFSNIARLNIEGQEIRAGYGIKISDTRLSFLMKKILNETGNKIFINMTDSALVYSNQVIKEFPNFPFGYYARAKILLNKGDQKGIADAIRAFEIFNITTSIEGHKEDHDQAKYDLVENVLKPLKLLK